MEQKFIAKDTDELPEIAEEITDIITDRQNDGQNPYNIILLYGAMGAGKTTLIKEICQELHVIDNITSPTFALINEYSTEYGDPIYHFDFYRINSIEEIFDLGYEEYFYSGHLCLIEWPEKAEKLIPKDDPRIKIGTIHITANEKEDREIVFKG
ncbi:MAG TPA: tRNA (adenosine(37)-N6)-threonylcarbamoyltransferase complex ATPase subunit type 1 TsaE [Candidatus Avirikenella pullistercoris]|mgnify:CR=1 FL=1|nr:tRNA (adenosine(37)-N6)-threonylcarbamoyltransferase complex ATPase subunit type 1 TsaE [Candidatus Avirikenella pullistercoris]